MSDKLLAMHWVLGLANTLPKFGGTIIISRQCTAHVEQSPQPPFPPNNAPICTQKKCIPFAEKAKGNICFCNHMHTSINSNDKTWFGQKVT